MKLYADTYPKRPSIPPCLPPTDLVKATAPPLTETALSIPLGFPCKTFSAKKAHPSTKSVSSLGRRSAEGMVRCWRARRKDAATQVEYAADDPRPAEIGRFEEAVKVTERL